MSTVSPPTKICVVPVLLPTPIREGEAYWPKMMSRWPQHWPPPEVGQSRLDPPGPSLYIHMASAMPTDGVEAYVEQPLSA